MSRSCASLLIAVLAAGCSSRVEGAADAGGGTDGAPSGTIADHVRFRGQLATSPTVPFGGDPFCDYDVRMRDVVVDVVLRGDDELVSIAIDNTMVEGIVGTCPHLPEAPSRQHFEYGGVPLAASAGGVFRPQVAGAPSNRPATALGVVVTPVGQDALEVMPRWQRTDQGPPLAWVVTIPAPIALATLPCEAGAQVCIGTTSDGVLYQCADGEHLAPLRRCTSGCATSQTACN